MNDRAVQDKRALVLGLGAVLLWSTVATAFKLALVELSVLQLLAIAIVSSTLVLVGVVCRQKKLSMLFTTLRKAPIYYLSMAALNPLAYYCILLAAYDLLPAQQAQTINYTWAIMLALLSIPFLGQRLGARDWLAVGLGYLGVVIIATEGTPSMNFSSGTGVVLALASTVIWAVFWLLSARSKDEPLMAMTSTFICACIPALVLLATLGGGMPEWGLSVYSAVYVGLFEMGVTWLLWSSAMRLASNVSRVGNLIFLSPILSLVFIATILGEAIHPATVVGLALIVPGILLQQRTAGDESAP